MPGQPACAVPLYPGHHLGKRGEPTGNSSRNSLKILSSTIKGKKDPEKHEREDQRSSRAGRDEKRPPAGNEKSKRLTYTCIGSLRCQQPGKYFGGRRWYPDNSYSNRDGPSVKLRGRKNQ